MRYQTKFKHFLSLHLSRRCGFRHDGNTVEFYFDVFTANYKEEWWGEDFDIQFT